MASSKQKNEETLKFLDDMQGNLKKAKGENPTLVIDESKHITHEEKNKMGAPQVAEDARQARRDSRLRSAKSQMIFDESETPEGELASADEDLVDDFVGEVVDGMLGF